jgi:hypothetical protein
MSERAVFVKIECEECEGTGRVLSPSDMSQNNGEGLYDECERCGGSGYLDDASLFRGEYERLVREAVEGLPKMHEGATSFAIPDLNRASNGNGLPWYIDRDSLLAALGVKP